MKLRHSSVGSYCVIYFPVGLRSSLTEVIHSIGVLGARYSLTYKYFYPFQYQLLLFYHPVFVNR